ncbi:hypothetical protein FA95DRAFT_1466105, partial [Auriscalpium vulgare]
MLAAAKEHDADFAALKLSRDLKRNLPAWYHIGTEKMKPITDKPKCLMYNHLVSAVGDLARVVSRLTNDPTKRRHFPRSTCACPDCRTDRALGCKNPHQCAETAEDLLTRMNPKTSLNPSPAKDDLTLTGRRLEKNAGAVAQKNGEVIFNPSVTTSKSMADCFRVF